MRIGLINPSCAAAEGRDLYTNDVAGALYAVQPFKKISMGVPLALPTLAAHTPAGHEVTIIDEEIERIDFGCAFDLVGITAMSFKAKRAYDIAIEFRKRGVLVVLGGIHASMCPDEALQYVDSVVIGEAEQIWASVVADAQNGQLNPIYQAEEFPDITQSRIPRYDLVRNKRYSYTYLQTTRGCPHNCTFCTVTKQNGHNLRKKRPEQVIAELDALLKLKPKKELLLCDRTNGRRCRFVGHIAFIDDNFAIDRGHALAVCAALKQYQQENDCIIGWYTQANIDIGFDEELLDAMADCNCWHVFVGLESLNPEILKQMKKNMNRPMRYAESIGNLHQRGIRVVASTMIGLDGTTLDDGFKLKAFIEENHLLHVLVNILTPYPGTAIREEFIRTDRLLTSNPQKYNIRNVVFKPHGMAKEQLEKMYLWLCRSFFNYRAAYRRGRPLLKTANRFCLPLQFRWPALAGFFFALVVLILRGRIRLTAIPWAFTKLFYLVLFDGSFYAIELLAMCLDYDDFARREERRLSGKTMGHDKNGDPLSIPHRIVTVKGSNGKKYRTFYLDAFDLCRFGFQVPPENIHRPILLLGGTSISITDRLPLMQSLLEAGYEVATIENPIGGLLNVGIHPAEERPAALREFLDHLRYSCGVLKVTLVAQSYSAFESVRVLSEDPLRYKDFITCLILVNPPGFEEHSTMAGHIWRVFGKHTIMGYLKPRSNHPAQAAYRRNERAGILAWASKTFSNITRGLREVRDVARYRIKTPVKELLGYGYRIGFFLQSDDQIHPARMTLKHAMGLVPAEAIKCVPGGHNDIFFQNWQRKAFMDFIDHMSAPKVAGILREEPCPGEGLHGADSDEKMIMRVDSAI